MFINMVLDKIQVIYPMEYYAAVKITKILCIKMGLFLKYISN